MDNGYDNLKKLLENIKTINFWGRLFKWHTIKNQLIDATADIQKLLTTNEGLSNRVNAIEQSNSNFVKDLQISNGEVIKRQSEIDKLLLTGATNITEMSKLNSELSSANTTVSNQLIRINELTSDNRILNEKNVQLTNENKRLTENNTQLLSNEEVRKQELSQQTATLKSIQDIIQTARGKEIQDKHDSEIERLNNLKLTWSNHQDSVKQTIKALCGKHTIEYVDKVPFKGEPDNTLNICSEYIIFDAKSPRGEDLSNFPNYIKEQSEKAKKYAKEENVKKWIFFVVPSNTLEVLKTYVYALADYDVFVITVDALEPIILSLKKIEEYDFAEQLNPEDRENICRVLGKFAHLAKRRIQIDTYFINQFMELAYKCESDLPSEILNKVIEYEKAEKLNPPQEKRAKAISIIELEKSTNKLRLDASSKGILIEDSKISTGLNEVPLYISE